MLVSGKTLFAFSNILSHLSAYCCFAWDHYSLPEQPKYHLEWVFMVSFISSITSLLVATGKLLANSYLDIESPRLFSRHLWWRFYVFLFIYDYLPNGHRYQQHYQLFYENCHYGYYWFYEHATHFGGFLWQIALLLTFSLMRRSSLEMRLI